MLVAKRMRSVRAAMAAMLTHGSGKGMSLGQNIFPSGVYG